MKLLISACLLGRACRYDGGTKPMRPELIQKLTEKYELIPVCPECMGGLPIPRAPSERQGTQVRMKTGEDVTENYRLGAQAVLHAAQEAGCTLALLKERSPSCGSGQIYDGTFTGALIPGDGVTAALLKRHGITVYGESQIDALL